MEAISGRYKDLILNMIKYSSRRTTVTSDDVYRPGNPKLLPFIDTMMSENVEPGSGIRSLENLVELARLAADGASCLLLLEHYSNFDLPAFSYLLRQAGKEGVDIDSRIVAVAGIKLTETDPVVAAFSEAYSRLVIYPSRSLEIIKNNIKDPKELVSEMMKGASINHAAMKALGQLKKSGKLILVFPAGTRYRPWDPSSKKGVREIDSYLKSFDYMSLVAVNGNILRVNPEGEMHEDLVCKDKVVFTAGAPLSCEEFRDRAKQHKHFRDDKKQVIVDALMAGLETMHEEAERSL